MNTLKKWWDIFYIFIRIYYTMAKWSRLQPMAIYTQPTGRIEQYKSDRKYDLVD
jgi:hypothetical protein